MRDESRPIAHPSDLHLASACSAGHTEANQRRENESERAGLGYGLGGLRCDGREDFGREIQRIHDIPVKWYRWTQCNGRLIGWRATPVRVVSGGRRWVLRGLGTFAGFRWATVIAAIAWRRAVCGFVVGCSRAAGIFRRAGSFIPAVCVWRVDGIDRRSALRNFVVRGRIRRGRGRSISVG